ncbi:hypothetical protein RhiirA5_411520 [Rhizophagus irregularis]|uniref:Uncharacterized protein n=1 Tax=Rhizophagus irregularis TaxID=588596 RepID=A0A2N0Q0W0_9GLOM|nr:hypothetical protein RhiirA5_411520 [Rhizophagus irregularis]
MNISNITSDPIGPILLLLAFMMELVFYRSSGHSSSTSGPEFTFYHVNGSFRLDYIWSSPRFPALVFFSQVVPCPALLNHPFTDHQVLVTVFNFSSCIAILAKSRLKQKKELCTIIAYSSTSKEQWNNFTEQVDDSFGIYLDKHYNSRVDFSFFSLDRMWHALKAAIFSTAIDTLPFHKVSNAHRHSYFPEPLKLIAVNKFLDHFLYRLTTYRSNRPT